MVKSLEQAFKSAIDDLNAMPKGMHLPEKTKLRLYGLYSSVVKGANLPEVSLSDLMIDKTEALKRKAWREALKLTKQQAMEEYCEIVNELQRTRQTGVKLSGHLYRKDNKNAWKPCHVELKERVIYYYDDEELSSMISLNDKLLKDQNRNYPSGLLFLMDGFVVSSSFEPAAGANTPLGEPLYQFSIAHPKSHKVFTLGCTRREEAQHWVDCIRLESARRSASYEMLASAKQSTVPAEFSNSFESKHFLPPIRSAQDFGVPAAFSFITDDAVGNFLNLISDQSIWGFSHEKEGVRTFIQRCEELPGLNLEDSKPAVAVLGHAPQIRAPVRSVFELVWTMGSRRNIDTQLESWSVVEELGLQTRVDHVVYSAVWPTSKRDFCRLSHFRVDEATGAVLVVGVSVKHLMCPSSREAVRAKLFCTGFLITPLSESTCEVKYLIVVDPVISSVPRRFIVSVAASQTSILEKMQQYFSEHEHLVHGGTLKGPVLNLALNSPAVGRRKKRSTTSIVNAAQFVKTEPSMPTAFPLTTLGSNIEQKQVRVSFSDDHPERWWIKFWFVAVSCAAATIGLDPSTLHLISLILASFAVILASNKRAFVSGIMVVHVGIDRRIVALALQNALRKTPSLNGTFSRFGMWQPASNSRVAVLSELKSGTATIYTDPSVNSSGESDGDDFTALFVTCGLASNHEVWSDRAALFSISGDRLFISVDRKCGHALEEFMRAIAIAIDALAPNMSPSGGEGMSQLRQHSFGRSPLMRSDSMRSNA